MVFSNVIVDVTVPRRSSVFSHSSVQISAGLTEISGLAVAAFDLINCSLSVPCNEVAVVVVLTENVV